MAYKNVSCCQKSRGGNEMRSRFWMGNKVERMDKFGQKIINATLNKPFVKRSLMPKGLGKYMFHHCTQKCNNLGEFLPEIYQEEASF